MQSNLKEVPAEILLAAEAGFKLALKELAKDLGDLRDRAEPDITHKDLVVTLQMEMAEIKVGHDTDKAPTSSIPFLAVLGVLTKRMGATRDDALKMVKDSLVEAMTLDKDATQIMFQETGVQEAVDKFKAEIVSKLDRTPVKKSVKASGVTVVVAAGKKL